MSQQTNKLLRGLYKIVGMPERHREALSAKNANHKLYFQALAVVAASIAAGYVNFIFSIVVLENAFHTSFFMGLVISAVFFVINRQAVIDRRLEPDNSVIQLWILRVGTIFMAVVVSLVLALDTFSEDTTRLREADIEKAKVILINSEEYKEELRLANERVQLEAKAVARAAELTNLLSSAKIELATARSGLKNELQGAFDPQTGRRKIAERGGEAIRWEGEILRLEPSITAMENESNQLRNSSKNLKDAEQQLQDLKVSVTAKAAAQFQGKANEFSYFFTLLAEQPSVWLPVAYGMIVSIIFEVLLLMALSRSSTLESAMKDILVLDQKLFQAKLLESAMSQKAVLNQGKAAIRVLPPPVKVVVATTPGQSTEESGASKNSNGAAA